MSYTPLVSSALKDTSGAENPMIESFANKEVVQKDHTPPALLYAVAEGDKIVLKYLKPVVESGHKTPTCGNHWR